MPDIDWSKFDYPIADTCQCSNCDKNFRSHAKYQDGAVWSKEPCPRCGCHRLRAVRGDPESLTLS